MSSRTWKVAGAIFGLSTIAIMLGVSFITTFKVACVVGFVYGFFFNNGKSDK